MSQLIPGLGGSGAGGAVSTLAMALAAVAGLVVGAVFTVLATQAAVNLTQPKATTENVSQVNAPHYAD